MLCLPLTLPFLFALYSSHMEYKPSKDLFKGQCQPSFSDKAIPTVSMEYPNIRTAVGSWFRTSWGAVSLVR